MASSLCAWGESSYLFLFLQGHQSYGIRIPPSWPSLTIITFLKALSLLGIGASTQALWGRGRSSQSWDNVPTWTHKLPSRLWLQDALRRHSLCPWGQTHPIAGLTSGEECSHGCHRPGVGGDGLGSWREGNHSLFSLSCMSPDRIQVFKDSKFEPGLPHP